MSNISREGHRERMRQTYINGGVHSMHDHNLLELLLSFVIKQNDVKQQAYDLMNHFGSLENIIQADPKALMQVKGVGERSAVLISLVWEMNDRININKNKERESINSTDEAKYYLTNELKGKTKETIMLITLDNSNDIIRKHSVAKGTVNFSSISERELLELILNDNASSVIIGHNHPSAPPEPSPRDINFTLNILDLLRRMNIEFHDHIIVGKNDTLSMKNVPRYSMYFSPNP